MAVSATVDLSRRCELMQVLQREAGGVVAPGRGPVRRRMASGALRSRQARGNVIGHGPTHGGRAVVLVLMAAVAIRVRGGKVVVVTDVARCAGGAKVRSGQRPAGSTVIKRSRSPGNRVVAAGTVRRRERRARGGMHGIITLLPGRKVAPRIPAIRRLNIQAEITVDVALRARCDLAGWCKLV